MRIRDEGVRDKYVKRNELKTSQEETVGVFGGRKSRRSDIKTSTERVSIDRSEVQLIHYFKVYTRDVTAAAPHLS